MHILITGGAGFVGSNTALALRAAFPDARITCLDNLYRNGSQLNLPRLESAGIAFHRGDVREVSSQRSEVRTFGLFFRILADL